MSRLRYCVDRGIEVSLHGIEIGSERSNKETFQRKLLAKGLDRVCVTCRHAVVSSNYSMVNDDELRATLRCDERSGRCPDEVIVLKGDLMDGDRWDGFTSTIATGSTADAYEDSRLGRRDIPKTKDEAW